MLRKTLVLTAAALLVALTTSTRAHAWGAYHAGFTHVGPSGVYHYGRTAAYGGYGGYDRYRYGGYRYGGYGNYGGYRYGGYHYSTGYGGVYGGGYRYGYRY